MAKKSSKYDEFDDSDFDDDDISSMEESEEFDGPVDGSPECRVATWRKIEDFWDNYELNKKINEDTYDDKYFDYLLDGELN